MVRQVGLPVGVVVNRVGLGDDRVHEFCASSASPSCSRSPTIGGSRRPIPEGGWRSMLLPEYSSGIRNAVAAHARPGGGLMKELVVISGKGGRVRRA